MQLTAYAWIALLSAVCMAAASIWIRQGLRQSNAHTGYWINLVVGVSGLWIAVLLFTPDDVGAWRALPFFIASGLIGTVGGRFTRFIGIDKVGASVGSAINNLNPFIAAGLAIVFLGEKITLPIVAATVVIVTGTILLSLSGRQGGFRPLHLIYPFTAAFCFGVVGVIRKLGLSEAGPIFGSAVNMTTALIVFTAFLLVSGRANLMRCRGESLWYFVAAGVAENTGVCLLIVALSLGQVSVVTPLSGTSPLFVLLLTSVFLRDVEALTPRILLGTSLIVVGVILLTAF